MQAKGLLDEEDARGFDVREWKDKAVVGRRLVGDDDASQVTELAAYLQ
jgi:hypothetical protein